MPAPTSHATGHCSGGAGVNALGNGTANGPVIDADHDLLKALERWVEEGVAPRKIIAVHFTRRTESLSSRRPLSLGKCPGE
jgi:hypothetical protein